MGADPLPPHTKDGFLDRRLTILQPRSGFRAGHDSVLLAASVPARDGDAVLELGSGAGVASLCLAARLKISVLGIEIDGDLVRLATASAARNGLAEHVRFKAGDVSEAEGLGPFDHVFFNPPFYPATGQISPNAARDRAMRDANGVIPNWVDLAFSVLKPGGTVTLITKADPLSDIIALCPGHEVTLFPLMAREDEKPSRMIVSLQEGIDNIALLGGLVLHDESGKSTAEADAVLRHGASLNLGPALGIVTAHSHS